MMRSLSIGRAWEEASAFLGRNMRLIVPVALATFVVAPTIANWMAPRGPMEPSTVPGLSLLMLLIILVLAFVGQMTIASMAIGGHGSVGEQLGHAFRRVWGVLGALFIVILPIMLIATIAAGSVLIGAGLTDPSAITPERLAQLSGFGAILLVALLALLSVWSRLFPISAVAMTEGSGPIALLKRCWALTRGHFWRLFATIMLILIAEIVLTQTFTFVGGVLFTLVLGEAAPFSVSALLISLFVALAGAAISVISAALIGRVYAQLAAPVATVPEVEREG